jgi:hypothetical protein
MASTYSIVERQEGGIQISSGTPVNSIEELSDGYHTFKELYDYRMLYNAAFFNDMVWYQDVKANEKDDIKLGYKASSVRYDVHKSKRHSDGEECFGGGWFIVMAELPTGQISNHYEMKYWDLFKIPEKEKANVWDGHTPQEAAERLRKYIETNYKYEQF